MKKMKYYNSYINMFTYIIKLKSKLFYFYIYSSSSFKIAPKHGIGWEVTEVGGNRITTKCKYCGTIIHEGIIKLKQHVIYQNKF